MSNWNKIAACHQHLASRPGVLAALLGASVLSGCVSEADRDVRENEAMVLTSNLPQDFDSDATRQFEIGVLDGNPEQTFGLIRDIAVTSDGLILVLDERYQNIRVFDVNGNFRQVLGRPGRGPGEFFKPMSVATGQDSDAYVLDPANDRVTLYRGADSLHLAAEFSPGFGAWDLCVADHRVFLLGFRDDKIIHEYRLDPDGTGAISRSFGAPYSDHPRLQRAFAKGFIECSAQLNSIITAPSALPNVRAYSFDGRLLWSRAVENFRQLIVTAVGETGARYEFPADGGRWYHHKTAVVGACGLVAVQTGVVTQATRDERDLLNLETHFLSIDNGAHASHFQSTILYGTVSKGVVYGALQTPFPRIVGYSLNLAGCEATS